MKKTALLFLLFVLAAVQAGALLLQTPEYIYFYKPLDSLLRQDPAAAENLRSAARVLPEDFDYTSLFGDADVVLLGEIHHKEIISREINIILKQTAKNASLGFTHLATEFLLQSAQASFDSLENKNIPLPELSKKLYTDTNEYDNGLVTIQMADGLGLHVVGLDIDEILKENGAAWGTSSGGLKIRNLAWFNKMDEVLKQNPKARFLVHCGALHSQYLPNSLSTLLKQNGLKTHVVLFEIGPDPAAEQRYTCQYFQNPKALPAFIWYQFFCRYGMERQNLLIKIPSRYVSKLGADTVVYFGNPNPLIKALPEEKTKLVKDLRYLNSSACRMHPDSAACKALREWSFRD